MLDFAAQRIWSAWEFCVGLAHEGEEASGDAGVRDGHGGGEAGARDWHEEAIAWGRNVGLAQPQNR